MLPIIAFEKHVQDVVAALQHSISPVSAHAPITDHDYDLAWSKLGQWLTMRCARKIHSRFKVCIQHWHQPPWEVILAWAPRFEDQTVIQEQSVRVTSQRIRSLLEGEGIQVMNEYAPFNMYTVRGWMRVLANRFASAKNAGDGSRPNAIQVVSELVVIHLLLRFRCIRAVITESSLSTLFEPSQRKLVPFKCALLRLTMTMYYS